MGAEGWNLEGQESSAMQSILSWVGTIILVVFVHLIATPIHDWFLNRSRPPEALTPERAPIKLETYLSAETVSHDLEMLDDELWTYTWVMTAQADPRDVYEFYRQAYPKVEFINEYGFYQAEFLPEGAGEEELVMLAIGPDEEEPGKTAIHLAENKRVKGGFVPPYRVLWWSIALVLIIGWNLLVAVITGQASVEKEGGTEPTPAGPPTPNLPPPPMPTPAATPEPVPAGPSEADLRAEFTQAIYSGLREMGHQVDEKEQLVIYLTRRGQREEVELDTLFFMWKNHVNDRAKIVANFLSQHK